MAPEEINEFRKKYEDGLITYQQYQSILKGENPFKEPVKKPETTSSTKLPFYLLPDEEIVKDAAVIQYYGIGIITVGFGGGAIGDSGFGGGIFTSKQQKREKSVLDATNCHVYLTNKRLVFVKAAFSMNLTAINEVAQETIFSDIPLNSIEGITPGTKFMIHATIDLSVRAPTGEINTISFAFLDNAGRSARDMFARNRRVAERDEFLKLIESKRQQFHDTAIKSQIKEDVEDPIKILKIRLAKGEITKEEYDEMMNLIK